MFNIFNSKYNKALNFIDEEIEDYKEREQKCLDMFREEDMADFNSLAQAESWAKYYRSRREALEDLKRKLEQYVS